MCVFGTNVARETGIPDVHGIDPGSVREAAIVRQIASRVQSEASFRRMGENRNVFVEERRFPFWSFLLRACISLIPYAILMRVAVRFAMSKGKIERPRARRVSMLVATAPDVTRLHPAIERN